MMESKLLTTEEYNETLSPQMINVTKSAQELVNLWAYADPIIYSEYHNCTNWDWCVNHIYESKDGLYQHIGIAVPKDNTYLTVIVNKNKKEILGHYILKLGKS